MHLTQREKLYLLRVLRLHCAKHLQDGYLPISLQYRPYTAATARAESLGQGDFREEDTPNRSYRGKTVTAANEHDLDLVLDTKAAMGDKPVIVQTTVSQSGRNLKGGKRA